MFKLLFRSFFRVPERSAGGSLRGIFTAAVAVAGWRNQLVNHHTETFMSLLADRSDLITSDRWIREELRLQR